MIINNKKNGAINVPCGEFDYVCLVPGICEVPDEKWAKARNTARRLIATGDLVEEFVKVDFAGTEGMPIVLPTEDAKETTRRLVPARLKDIDRKGQKVQTIVKNTYHIPTLQAWMKDELRADVRLDLQHQLQGVESGEIKG